MGLLMASRNSKRDRLVFVDPDDSSLPYWWPALIVTEDELALFRETMDSSISHIPNGDHLVCYFEDGSFSIVPKTALKPFDPEDEPYQTYKRISKKFGTDQAVQRATSFWETGIVPAMFKWLLVLKERRKRKKTHNSESKVDKIVDKVAERGSENGKSPIARQPSPLLTESILLLSTLLPIPKKKKWKDLAESEK